ncbi:MAG: class I adenylate-forming enzyme family protein, partial [Lautropia sp.]
DCAARHRDRDLTATITEAVSIAKTPRVVVMGGTVSAGQTRSTWDTFLEAGESLPAEALANAAAAVDEHDLLLVQYTSGTTAFPKGVELRQGQLLRSGRAMASRLGLGSEDRFFSPMPFFHIGGSTASLITALVSGATLVFQDQFDAAGALEALERERCTCACGVDTMFVDMLAQPGFDAKKLCVRTGWTLYNAAVFAAFPGMMQVYALSECSSVVTICDWRDPFERRRDTCGYPIEGTEVRIVDIESLAPLPPDTPGRILVRGWCTTSGYFRQPEQTAHLLIDDRWLDTGDYGRVLESGDLIFMGRLKDVLRVGGENVASAEVEAVLNAHPAVLRSAVVPLPHPRLKEVPLAFVQLRPGSEVSAQALSDHCASRLAPFKVPRQVEFVSAFTMTESGKIIKRTLVEQVQRTARASA